MTGPLFCGWVGGIGKVGIQKTAGLMSSGIFLSILFELFLITQLQCYQQQQQCQQQ